MPAVSLFWGGRMKCPSCESVDVRRSLSQGAEKIPRYLFARKFYRCQECNNRFAQHSLALTKEDKKVVWTWVIIVAAGVLLAGLKLMGMLP
jgi:C4-type Zn-finger protein